MGIKVYRYEDDGVVKFAAVSSYNDSVVAFDMTQDDFVEWWGERAKQNAIHDLKHEFEMFDERVKRNVSHESWFITDDVDELRKAIRYHLRLKNISDQEYNARVKQLLQRIKEKT